VTLEDSAFACTVPDEDRSTHFLSIRITTDQIVDRAVKVQQHAVEQEEVLSECCMKLGLFHVTVCMLKLKGEEGEREMVELVKDLAGPLAEAKCRLRIGGLKTFGQRVLYAKVTRTNVTQFFLAEQTIYNL
jgi:hypothetical protein